jgi:cation diffusion facilitator CzcD-associated flavoprotein CzcO
LAVLIRNFILLNFVSHFLLDWTKEFAAQPEILEYMKSVARKFDIYKYTKFRHQVKRLTWSEKESKWKVLVLNLDTKEEELVLYDIMQVNIKSC